jgi:predicted ATPase/transcriptional regulator with XRE-family HTH domain/Tfp pilus assembly protein PilF
MHTNESTSSFGYWMRRQRQALDLTQAALARQVGCATVTISKLERDERRPSRQMAELLAEHLAVPDEQRVQFLTAACGERAVHSLPLTHQPVAGPTPASVAPPRHNLPVSLAPAIERTGGEIALLALLVDPHIRLITLVGPGGVGKTHLSLRVAEKAADRFRDGVTFVPLDAIRSPEMVLAALAAALGVMESGGQSLRDSLLAALEYKRSLLVLDNFEQVLEAAGLVALLLQNCPHLKVIVTSREALHLRGEQVYPLRPLALPAASAASVDEFSHSPAVQLFALRARSVQPDFILDGTTAPTVAAICAALDGLPLAIELAAARLSLFSLASLLRHLGADEQATLQLLRTNLRDTAQRQRSLRDTVAWSYDLLAEPEQMLFRRLAVFVGAFSLEAAQAVGTLDATPENAPTRWETLELLDSLAAQSLLVSRPGADRSTRFALLQTIRDFAAEQLSAQGEAEAAHRAHARWYAALAAAAEEEIVGPAQVAWLERLYAEADNLHAAIGWSLDSGEIDLALTFGETLMWFWWLRNLLGVGRYWLRRLLPLLQPEIPLARQAKIRSNAGMTEMLQGDYIAAAHLLEAALLQARESNSLHTEVAIRSQLGWVRTWQGSFDEAVNHYETAIRLCQEHGFVREMALAQTNLGVCRLHLGDTEQALHLYRSGIEKFRENGDHWGMSWVLSRLASLLSAQGAFAEAHSYAEEGLSHSRILNDRLAIAWSLAALGTIALDRKNFDQARRILLEILQLRWNLGDRHGAVAGVTQLAQVDIERDLPKRAIILARVAQKEDLRIMGIARGGTEGIQLDEIFEAARSALSPEEYAAALAEGDMRSLADVVEELLHG